MDNFWVERFAFIEKDYENILITFPVEYVGILWNTVFFFDLFLFEILSFCK